MFLPSKFWGLFNNLGFLFHKFIYFFAVAAGQIFSSCSSWLMGEWNEVMSKKMLSMCNLNVRIQPAAAAGKTQWAKWAKRVTIELNATKNISSTFAFPRENLMAAIMTVFILTFRILGKICDVYDSQIFFIFSNRH